MNKDWHNNHFCCWQCDDSLTGQRYVLRDDHPYCIKCYEDVFANNCKECNKIIGIDSKVRMLLVPSAIYSINRFFFCRICRTRTSTGMKRASSAVSVACPWLTSSSAPNRTRSTAATAMIHSLLRAAMDVEKYSERVSTTVVDYSLDRLIGLSV